MTEKRFKIVKSKLVEHSWVINDKLKQFTFPTLRGDKRGLVSYCKVLNELHEEKEIAIDKNNAITYKELDKIVIEVMEGYLNMLQAGNMSFSEFAILENVLLKLNEGINKKKRSKDNGKK